MRRTGQEESQDRRSTHWRFCPGLFWFVKRKRQIHPAQKRATALKRISAAAHTSYVVRQDSGALAGSRGTGQPSTVRSSVGSENLSGDHFRRHFSAGKALLASGLPESPPFQGVGTMSVLLSKAFQGHYWQSGKGDPQIKSWRNL